MIDFYQLTYQGRARRLRKMAVEALKSYPLDVARVRLMTIETNGVFRVDTHDGEKYVLRISDPTGCHEEAEIRSEAAWMNALAEDADVQIPVPVLNRQGEFVSRVEIDGVPEARLCILFSWVRGRDLAEQINTENLASLGSVTARLHMHGRKFVPPDWFRARTMNSVFPYADPSFEHVEKVVLFEDQYSTLISDVQKNLFRNAADQVQQELDRMYSSGEPLTILHNDLHQWNVLVFRKRLTVLDFEDLMWGYPIQDIGTTWLHFLEQPGADELLDAYREGYSRHLPWPEEFPGQLNLMIAARVFNLLNYVVSSPLPEDQEFAPGYVVRNEERLRRLLDLGNGD